MKCICAGKGYTNMSKILIADDDYDIIAYMHVILRNSGHDIIESTNSKEALEKFSQFNPEIIFLDLMMEKFDSGVTVCRKIRETDKKVKIYLISAVGDEAADIPEASEIGFNGVISKPITAKKLLELVC